MAEASLGVGTEGGGTTAGAVGDDVGPAVTCLGSAGVGGTSPAKVPRTRYTPLTAQRTQDVFTLLGWAVSDGRRTVRQTARRYFSCNWSKR